MCILLVYDLVGQLPSDKLMARLQNLDDMDPNDTNTSTTELATSDGRDLIVTREEDPYTGLNRAQRRKAMAVEARAHRKAKHGRI